MIADEEIIRRCQQGQMGLMDILIDRYTDDLYSHCMRLTRSRNDADDLFQDTWMRVMKKLSSYSEAYPFRTWLFTLCMNRYRDLYRWNRRWKLWRRRREAEHNAGVHTALAGRKEQDPEEQLLAEESRARMRRAIDSLAGGLREPVLLFYFHGFSVSETAEILQIPAGTVKSRLHKARELLKAAMEGSQDE